MKPRTITIGDIHGCIKTFEKMLETIELQKEDRLILLGDYIDRGPDSKAVVDLILALRDDSYDIITLMGNHEKMLLDSIENEAGLLNWKVNGAQSTLKSFGISKTEHLESKYIDFFKALQYYYLNDDYIFVHAGLNYSDDNPFEDKYSMLWTREKRVDLEKTDGRKVIVGHTPTQLERIKKSLDSNLLFLDGGCVYAGWSYGLGFLCAYDTTNKKFFSLESLDKSLV